MVRPLLLLLLLPACIGAQARLHVGPTIDSSGEVGVHGGLTAGFGYSTSERSGVLINAGIVTGSQSQVAVSSVIDGVKLAEDEGDLGHRGGVRFDAGLVGDRSFVGATGAVLYPLRQRSSSGGHEKSWQSTSATALLVGLEGQFGAVIIDEDQPGGAETRAGGGLALTLEWMMFSRFH